MDNYEIIWTEEKKEQALEKITKYLKAHGIGECIMQSDNAIIEAPEVFVDIADNVLKYKEGIKFIDPYE